MGWNTRASPSLATRVRERILVMFIEHVTGHTPRDNFVASFESAAHSDIAVQSYGGTITSEYRDCGGEKKDLQLFRNMPSTPKAQDSTIIHSCQDSAR